MATAQRNPENIPKKKQAPQGGRGGLFARTSRAEQNYRHCHIDVKSARRVGDYLVRYWS
ncbi:hypothetical protein MNBD_ACTINO02-1622 [hydrothermal vent metagenome]|uniref:Uncharacterized protein n=1 Tax=hydrothermal vent metagenome TaxID=652676 RepID=A0A3B0SXH7_9ZZZZ